MRSIRTAGWLVDVIIWLVFLALFGAIAGCSPDSSNRPQDTPRSSVPPSTPDTTTTTSLADPAFGSTEVGTVMNLPLLGVDWTWVELEIDDPDTVDAWMNRVSFIDGQFVAVAFAWRSPPDNQSVYTWTSPDGSEWTRSELAIPQGETMNSAIATNERLLGLGQQTREGTMYPKLWSFDPLVGWTTWELDVPGTDLHDVNIYAAAASEAGVVLGGGLDIYRNDIPVTFESRGFRFELDDYQGSFLVAETTTGRVVTEGRWADLYRWSEDGQAIYDTDTAALITIVPWEVWDGIYPSFSPLPIPVVAAADFPLTHTVEWDGYEIMVDEGQDRFTVYRDSQIATEGRLQDLYRGPAPSFSYSSTNEPAVSFTWDEWDQLVNAAYEGFYEDSHVRHESQQLILFSADGVTWSRRILGDEENTHLESVASVGDAFVVTLVEHRDDGPRRTAFTSIDGTGWIEIDATGPEYSDSVYSGPHGLIAISWGSEGPAVETSDDGIIWSAELTLGAQDDDREGWLRLVASGDMGRAALGTLSQAPPYENLRITVGDRTAEFGGPDWALRIAETVSGDLLLEAGWNEIEEAASAGDPRFASYEAGATTLFSREGEVLMVIPDQLALEAMEEQSEANQAGTDHVLFLEIDEHWHEVAFPDDKTPEALALGKDVIVVGTVTYPGYGSTDGASNQLGLFLGELRSSH